MKLYDAGRAPNPRRVRVFLAEKGVTVPVVSIDLARLEHKAPAYVAVNPLQRTPALELDDGTVISEQRRLEFGLLGTVAAVFRHLHPAMAEMEVPQVAAWGETNKPRVIEFLRFLDGELADRRFIAGDRFSIADITGLVGLDFMKPAKLSLPDDLANVRRWHAELAARPSAQA